MRLDRDSQFSLMFWLGVALMVCRASLLPVGVGGRLVFHGDDQTVCDFIDSTRGHVVSSCFSFALWRGSVSTDVVCTRRFRGGSVPRSYLQGVGLDTARVGQTVATVEKSGDLVVTAAPERAGTPSDGDVCMAMSRTPIQAGALPARIGSRKDA